LAAEADIAADYTCRMKIVKVEMDKNPHVAFRPGGLAAWRPGGLAAWRADFLRVG
jgi:hypothetical protein